MKRLLANRKLFTIGIVAIALCLVVAALLVRTFNVTPTHAATWVGTNASHCTSLGSWIESDNIYKGNTIIGELDIYYNSSTGYNCAYTRSVGSTYGVAKYMQVVLMTCANTTPSSTCQSYSSQQWAEDVGNYKYYAGPVGVYGRGRCIAAIGSIYYSAFVNADYSAGPGASHCG